MGNMCGVGAPIVSDAAMMVHEKIRKRLKIFFCKLIIELRRPFYRSVGVCGREI